MPTLKPKKIPKKAKEPSEVHRWRLCPAGSHWVRDHQRRVRPSSKNPLGETQVQGHCAKNPSHRDQLYPDEIQEIAKHHFADLSGGPKANNLGFSKGNDFDSLIRGWTRYWNEVLKPVEPLDPDLIKALIASESGFEPQTGKGTKQDAKGLMQILSGTLVILRNEKGELRDRLINMTKDDRYDPNLSIAAGIRWLFNKKALEEHSIGHPISWREAVAKYKGYKPTNDGMKPFDSFYKRLKK